MCTEHELADGLAQVRASSYCVFVCPAGLGLIALPVCAFDHFDVSDPPRHLCCPPLCCEQLEATYAAQESLHFDERLVVVVGRNDNDASTDGGSGSGSGGPGGGSDK